MVLSVLRTGDGKKLPFRQPDIASFFMEYTDVAERNFQQCLGNTP